PTTTGAPSNPDLCRLITRDPVTQRIIGIDNLNTNVGKEALSGVDIGLRYALPTRALGRFGLTFDGTWLRNHDLTLPTGRVLHGRGTFDLAGQNGNFSGLGGVNPAWRFNSGVTWARGPLGAGVQTRFIGSFRECGTAAGAFNGGGLCSVDPTYQRKVSAYATVDTAVSYTLASVAGATTLTLGVNNLFNAAPPSIYNGGQDNTDATTYDLVGRFVYGRITHRL
ncbi:MAG TPA: hypothetical protein VMK66_17275, partial [Myxococcales bacterium]|nr:hypothetical protein [Myxococcales bacterium]